MNGWLLAAIIAVVVVVVVIKRLRGEPVNLRELLATPVILIGVGVMSLVKAEDVVGADYAWAVPGAVLGLVLGAARGATVQLFEKGGVLWQRYVARTFLVVLASLVVVGGYGVLAVKMGMHESARPAQLNIGISFLGEALMVAWRGRATGLPFAPRSAGPLDRLDEIIRR